MKAHLCPFCNGRPLLVGCYGAVTILRCRDCGEAYSTSEPVNAGVFSDEDEE